MKEGAPAQECPEAGEVIWRDDLGVTCRRWNWRQDVRSLVTPLTTEAVVTIQSNGVGDVVVHGVDGIVSSGSMPIVLLGNSFLTHFQMTRTNDQMVLEKRY